MDDYIKREAAIEICEAECQARLRMCDYSGYTVAWSVGSEIKALPAADVAPVVHCKDCAHRTEMGNCGHPRYHGILPSAYPYDFCSYGARMDGGAE